MEIERKVYFIHIPKTAGSSFNGILRSKYPAEKRFHVTAGSVITAKRYYEITSEIVNELDERIVGSIKLLHGHIPYVPISKYADFSYITFLRDPVKRVVSDYLFLKSTPTLPIYHIVNNLSLRQYVAKNEDLHIDNLQTRLISGKMTGAVTEDDLRKAQQNLFEKFDFYGLTEYFDPSLVMLNRAFNWNIDSYIVKNVTKAKSDEIKASDLEEVRRFNAMDIALYDIAKAKFLAIMKEDESLMLMAERINKIGNSSRSTLTGRILGKFRKLIK